MGWEKVPKVKGLRRSLPCHWRRRGRWGRRSATDYIIKRELGHCLLPHSRSRRGTAKEARAGTNQRRRALRGSLCRAGLLLLLLRHLGKLVRIGQHGQGTLVPGTNCCGHSLGRSVLMKEP